MSKRPARRHLRRKPGARAPADTFIVTGGAGFVGSNLVARLLARTPRPRVVVVDSFRTGATAALVEACVRGGVGPFDGSVIAESSADVDWHAMLAVHSARAVFHLGAITDTTVMDEALMLRENVGGFRSMLHACHEAKTPLVYASSAATYGAPSQASRREAFPEEAAGYPSNPYGFSKWMMEVEHRAFAAQVTGAAGARVVGLRYFNVFGPGESRKGPMASMVYQLAMRMLGGQAPRLFTDGSQSRDQVHVDDVVSATIAASGIDRVSGGAGGAEAVRPGVYNVGSGEATSFNDLVAWIREALELPESRLATEYFEMPASVRAFYQEYTRADLRAIRAGVGWTPRVSVREGVVSYVRLLAAEEKRRRG